MMVVPASASQKVLLVQGIVMDLAAIVLNAGREICMINKAGASEIQQWSKDSPRNWATN